MIRRAARSSSPPSGSVDRLWRITAWTAGGIFSLFLGLFLGFQLWAPQLVHRFQVVQANSSENTIIFDSEDRMLATVEGLEDRHTVPIDRISPYMQKAIVAIEDRRFFDHRGMDPVRLLGAVWADVKALAFKQGGSTITQQLVKLTLLSSERTLVRKAKEVFMALALEQEYPKLQVLEFYLNRVYLGHGVYGVEKASRAYFGKPASELLLNEAAWLAALVKKPEGYLQLPPGEQDPGGDFLPVEALKPLMKRARLVLEALRELNWVTREELDEATAQPLTVLRPVPQNVAAPYFVQQVLKRMREKLGVQQISGRGYRVYTSLNSQYQRVAERLVADTLDKHPSATQAALLAMDTRTGMIHALVGGRDFSQSQFNRATQARRQPGSAFKPLLYATALEEGLLPNSVYQDEPVRYAWSDGAPLQIELEPGFALDALTYDGEPPKVYEPRNFGDGYGEPASVRSPQYALDTRLILGRALERSSNVIAVQLLDTLGMSPLIRLTRRLGITLRSKNGLCVALGCSEVTLLELTSAYTTFANGGLRVEPTFIRRITNSSDEVLYEVLPQLPEQAISTWSAFQMQRLLTNVMIFGTGVRARISGPVGGKTGTNDGPRDAWFVGFTPTVATGVWLGNDDNTLMPDEQGGRGPARLWKQFMTAIRLPGEQIDFPQPESEYTEIEVCTVTGKIATAYCPTTRVYAFRSKERPEEICDLHSGPVSTFGIALGDQDPAIGASVDEVGIFPYAVQLRRAFTDTAHPAAPLDPSSMDLR